MISQAEISASEAANRAGRFPVGAAVEFADLERADRVEVFDRLRATEPISWVPAMGGWLVTSYPLARSVLDPRASFTVEAQREPGAGLTRSDDADHGCVAARRDAHAVRSAVSPAGGGAAFRRAGGGEGRAAAGMASSRAGSVSWRASSRRRLRSALQGTCSGSRSTTCRGSAASTTPSPAAWCTTVIPNRSGCRRGPGRAQRTAARRAGAIPARPRCLGHLGGGVRPRSPTCGR